MTVVSSSEAPRRRGLALPSAYTILFILIVLVALLTWIIPAGKYDVDADGEPIPGTYHTVEANPQRIVVDSLAQLASTSQLVRTARQFPTIVATGPDAPVKDLRRLAAPCQDPGRGAP